jgi:hypothetical protein
MCYKLRKVIDEILVKLFGKDKLRGFLKSTRIVANTYIIIGVSESARLPDTHYDLYDSPVHERNVTDALTLGHATVQNNRLLILKEAGKLALVASNILPHYRKLRFVDGRSDIATLILAVQAIGYVISVVYRAIHHLPVSPIEAIGFAYSLLVIVHSVVHSVAVICQNTLLIYLDSKQQEEMEKNCQSTRERPPAGQGGSSPNQSTRENDPQQGREAAAPSNIREIQEIQVGPEVPHNGDAISPNQSIRWSNKDEIKRRKAAMVGTVVVGSVVVALTILVELHVLRKSCLDAIGPILFLFSLIPQSFAILIREATRPPPQGETLAERGATRPPPQGEPLAERGATRPPPQGETLAERGATRPPPQGEPLAERGATRPPPQGETLAETGETPRPPQVCLSTFGSLIRFGSWMISFGGIVVSMVATILNWQTHKFDSRTPSVIHNWPFLG